MFEHEPPEGLREYGEAYGEESPAELRSISEGLLITAHEADAVSDEYAIPQEQTETAGTAEQPQLDGTHSAAGIAELGMTVTQQIRHRWTGELPDDVEFAMQRTYYDQMRRSTFWGAALPAEKVTSPAQVDKALAPAPDLPTLAEFKPWALGELNTVAGDIQRLLDDAPDASPAAHILARASRWYGAHATWRPGASGDPDLHKAYATHNGLMKPVLSKDGLASDAKADLVDSVAMVAEYTYTADAAEALHADLQTNGPALCIDLLRRDTSGGALAVAAINRVTYQGLTAMYQQAPAVLQPLAERIQRNTAKGIGRATVEFELLHELLSVLDSDDPEAMQAAQNIDFQQIADTVLAVCVARGAALRGHEDRLSHRAVETILATLEVLYLPHVRPQLTVPPELSDFLEPVYHSRFRGHEDRRELTALRYSFNTLAQAAGSPLRTYGN